MNEYNKKLKGSWSCFNTSSSDDLKNMINKFLKKDSAFNYDMIQKSLTSFDESSNEPGYLYHVFSLGDNALAYFVTENDQNYSHLYSVNVLPDEELKDYTLSNIIAYINNSSFKENDSKYARFIYDMVSLYPEVIAYVDPKHVIGKGNEYYEYAKDGYNEYEVLAIIASRKDFSVIDTLDKNFLPHYDEIINNALTAGKKKVLNKDYRA